MKMIYFVYDILIKRVFYLSKETKDKKLHNYNKYKFDQSYKLRSHHEEENN